MNRLVGVITALLSSAVVFAASTGTVSEVPVSTAPVVTSTPVFESQTAPAPDPLPPPANAPVELNQVVLTAEEVAPACKIIKERHPVRSESQVFYEHGVNSMRLPLVFSKADQGFACGRDKGVVYYVQYVDVDGRKNAELAARTSLWKGDTQATSRNPEQIFGWDRFLIITSFKDPAWKSVVAPLIKKFKRLQAAHP